MLGLLARICLWIAWMEILSLCIALGPLAAYLLMLGRMNLSRRPQVISGTRETAALGLALSGLMIVGPGQLFRPDAASSNYGSWVWLLMLSFYLLCIVLWMLLARQRLVIYNITAGQLRPTLSAQALVLDSDARWAGNNLCLPQMGVQLRVEDFPGMRNVSLISTQDDDSYSGWRRLENSLRSALGECEVAPNPRGAGLLVVGLVLLTIMLVQAASDPESIAQGLIDFLQL
jgi:hypothetical protein